MAIAWITLPSGSNRMPFAQGGAVWKQIAERINVRVTRTRRNLPRAWWDPSIEDLNFSSVATTWPGGLMSGALDDELKAEYWPELIRIAAGRLESLIKADRITMPSSGLAGLPPPAATAGVFANSNWSTPYTGVGSASDRPIAQMLSEHPPENPNEWGGWVRYLRDVIDGLTRIRWDEAWVPALEPGFWEFYAGRGPVAPNQDPVVPAGALPNAGWAAWFFQEGGDVSPQFFNSEGGFGPGTASALSITSPLGAPSTPQHVRRRQVTSASDSEWPGWSLRCGALARAGIRRRGNPGEPTIISQAAQSGRWWVARSRLTVGAGCDVEEYTFTPGLRAFSNGELDAETIARVYVANATTAGFNPVTAVGPDTPPGTVIETLSPVPSSGVLNAAIDVSGVLGSPAPSSIWISVEALIEGIVDSLAEWSWHTDAFFNGSYDPVSEHFEQIHGAPDGTFIHKEISIGLSGLVMSGAYSFGTLRGRFTMPEGE